MTHEPDLTERQEQVLWALMGEKMAADIDPTETGGLADDELAQHLGVSEEEIRHDIQALIDLGFIEHGPAESTVEDDWFRQVECDWQWSDGRYCNMTVHFYALAAGPPQGGHTDVEASLAGYCSLEHAYAAPPPTLAGGPAAVRGDRRGHIQEEKRCPWPRWSATLSTSPWSRWSWPHTMGSISNPGAAYAELTRCARMPHRQLAMPAALRAHHHSQTRSRVTGRTAAMTAVSNAHRPPRRTAAGKGTTKNARNTE
jgi:hypothetical protein